MSADPTTAPRPTVPPDHPEAPLYELAAKYPEPDWREWAVDRTWLGEQESSGALDALRGKVVAVHKKQIIGVGDDYVAMLIELSQKYDVHPGRIVVVGLEE
jgi:hypothetical protein